MKNLLPADKVYSSGFLESLPPTTSKQAREDAWAVGGSKKKGGVRGNAASVPLLSGFLNNQKNGAWEIEDGVRHLTLHVRCLPCMQSTPVQTLVPFPSITCGPGSTTGNDPWAVSVAHTLLGKRIDRPEWYIAGKVPALDSTHPSTGRCGPNRKKEKKSLRVV